MSEMGLLPTIFSPGLGGVEERQSNLRGRFGHPELPCRTIAPLPPPPSAAHAPAKHGDGLTRPPMRCTGGRFCLHLQTEPNPVGMQGSAGLARVCVSQVLVKLAPQDRVIVFVDSNARVGHDADTCVGGIGRHGPDRLITEGGWSTSVQPMGL